MLGLHPGTLSIDPVLFSLVQFSIKSYEIGFAIAGDAT
jgi:hypothetical protein